MSEIKVFKSDKSNERLDVWLSIVMDEYSRSYIQKLIKEGQVLVNNKSSKVGYKIEVDDIVEVHLSDPKSLELVPQDKYIEIIFEDEDIIVVNKPKGMVVHPAPGNYDDTLVNVLLSHCKDNLSNINGVIRPGIVHRIDKDTSGSLVVAKNNYAHEWLTQLFKKHDIKRKYLAIVKGVIGEDSGKIDMPIGRHPVDRKKMAVNLKNGKNAVTYFKVLQRFKKNTYIEVTLETGRTHQIRVHMSHIGYPIVGDGIYGSLRNEFNITGQALHAQIIGFEHPRTKKLMTFEAKKPDYFEKTLEVLRKRS